MGRDRQTDSSTEKYVRQCRCCRGKQVRQEGVGHGFKGTALSSLGHSTVTGPLGIMGRPEVSDFGVLGTQGDIRGTTGYCFRVCELWRPWLFILGELGAMGGSVVREVLQLPGLGFKDL